MEFWACGRAESSSTPLSAPPLLSVFLYNDNKLTHQTAWRSGHPGLDSTDIPQLFISHTPGKNMNPLDYKYIINLLPPEVSKPYAW